MKLNLDSKKFKSEMQKTKVFAEKVCSKMGFYPNPIEEINTRIYTGLTRNKFIHGERYCPCFMVIGATTIEKQESLNRVCPCVPALEKEIPREGKCHCGIFCSEEYITNYKKEGMKKSVQSSSLSKEDIIKVLKHNEITGKELMGLLKARSLSIVDFILVDVRENSEYHSGRIFGVDYLIPTSNFASEIKSLENKKDCNIIVQCHSGGRSHQVQQIMKKMGYRNVINLSGGISSYEGKIVK